MNNREMDAVARGEKRICVVILEDVVEDGQYVPCIAAEDVQGYYKTAWRWGSNLEAARKRARQRNEAMGLTPEDAVAIHLSTMRS